MASLSCNPIYNKHTSLNIQHAFLDVLSDWNLTIENYHAIIHDNVANITKSFRDLGCFHCSCSAHSL